MIIHAIYVMCSRICKQKQKNSKVVFELKNVKIMKCRKEKQIK